VATGGSSEGELLAQPVELCPVLGFWWRSKSIITKRVSAAPSTKTSAIRPLLCSYTALPDATTWCFPLTRWDAQEAQDGARMDYMVNGTPEDLDTKRGDVMARSDKAGPTIHRNQPTWHLVALGDSTPTGKGVGTEHSYVEVYGGLC
jgi:hypothetical protein